MCLSLRRSRHMQSLFEGRLVGLAFNGVEITEAIESSTDCANSGSVRAPAQCCSTRGTSAWQVLFEVLAQTLTSWLGWELETTLVQTIYLEWVASAWSGCVSLCLRQASIRPCTVPGTCRLRGSGDLWCSVQMPVLVALCDYPSVYRPSKMRGALQFEQSGHHGCLLWAQKNQYCPSFGIHFGD